MTNYKDVCQKCGKLALVVAFTGYACACPAATKIGKENPDFKPLTLMQAIANASVGSSSTTGMINFNPPNKAPNYVSIYHFMADRDIPGWEKD